MTTSIITGALTLGAWTFAEAHAQEPAPQQQEQQTQQQEQQKKQQDQQKHAQKQTQKKGQMQGAQFIRDDIREWMSAWNQLDPQQRQSLVTTARTSLQGIEGLSQSTQQSLMQGLDVLEKNPQKTFQQLDQQQQQKIRSAMTDLRKVYVDLDTPEKMQLLASLADQKKSGQQAKAQGSQAMKLDVKEWMTAWDQLDPQDRQALITAGRVAVGDIAGISEQQQQTLIRGLDALAQNPQAKYADLTEQQKQAVQTAMQNLRSSYMDLDPSTKAQLMAEVAEEIRVRVQQGQAQPGPK